MIPLRCNGMKVYEGKGIYEVVLVKPISRLNQWPVQINLLPVQAPFYNGAKLLIAANCVAYAYANCMKSKITLMVVLSWITVEIFS